MIPIGSMSAILAMHDCNLHFQCLSPKQTTLGEFHFVDGNNQGYCI